MTPTTTAGPATGVPLTGRTLTIALDRAARRLGARLAELEEQLDRGDLAAWPPFAETVQALAVLLPVLEPGRRGELLTTAQLAGRLGISSKTLLRRRALGQVKPAVQLGKRGRAALRWRGDEVPK